MEKWLASHAEELTAALDDGSLQDKKLIEEIRKLKMANDTRAGLVVERAAVFAAFTRGAQRLKTFRCEFEGTWPAKLAGLPDVPAAREECRRIMDKIYEVFRSIGDEFEPLDGPKPPGTRVDA